MPIAVLERGQAMQMGTPIIIRTVTMETNTARLEARTLNMTVAANTTIECVEDLSTRRLMLTWGGTTQVIGDFFRHRRAIIDYEFVPEQPARRPAARTPQQNAELDAFIGGDTNGVRDTVDDFQQRMTNGDHPVDDMLKHQPLPRSYAEVTPIASSMLHNDHGETLPEHITFHRIMARYWWRPEEYVRDGEPMFHGPYRTLREATSTYVNRGKLADPFGRLTGFTMHQIVKFFTDPTGDEELPPPSKPLKKRNIDL